MEKKDYFESTTEKNEFSDDIVFARFINYMQKAILHKKINYLKHKEYLCKKERIITNEEWMELSSNDEICSSFDFKDELLNTKTSLKYAIENELTEKQKIIIISYYYDEKPLKVIAQEFNTTVDAVEHAKQRAIMKLRKYLEVSDNGKQN